MNASKKLTYQQIFTEHLQCLRHCTFSVFVCLKKKSLLCQRYWRIVSMDYQLFHFFYNISLTSMCLLRSEILIHTPLFEGNLYFLLWVSFKIVHSVSDMLKFHFNVTEVEIIIISSPLWDPLGILNLFLSQFR